MAYVRKRARNWVYQHPHVHGFIRSNRLQFITWYLRGLPDFVIIGAQKSGTTSLYDFIIKHPTIAPAFRKEPSYFSVYYKYGEPWYRSMFPTNISKYYFSKKTDKKLLSGEASTAYLFWPTAPGRMKKILPNVKLIAILRNPVDRAYSHYHHTLRVNEESLSFEGAIELEEERCAGEKELLIKDPTFIPNHHIHHSYLARGVYADQLENWFRYYDREQFLILTTEEFCENPQLILDQVFKFLKVPSFQIKDLRNLNVGYYKAMNKETRKFLIEYFKIHNERLSKLLQRNFNWNK